MGYNPDEERDENGKWSGVTSKLAGSERTMKTRESAEHGDVIDDANDASYAPRRGDPDTLLVACHAGDVELHGNTYPHREWLKSRLWKYSPPAHLGGEKIGEGHWYKVLKPAGIGVDKDLSKVRIPRGTRLMFQGRDALDDRTKKP